MSILFGYIFRQYFRIFAMCQIGLTSIYLIVDFFEKLRKFLRFDAEFSAILLYFFYRIPDIAFTLAPLAGLMATLLTIGILHKNHEITAMRSCGFSLFQVTAPFLMTGILSTVILFSFTAVIIPLSNHKAENIKTVRIQKKPQPLAFTAENLWLRLRDNTIVNVEKVDPSGSTLRNLSVYRLTPQFDLASFVYSPQAQFTSSGWILPSSLRREIGPHGLVTSQTQSSSNLDLSLTPEDLMAWMALEPEHMTLRQLKDHIGRLKAEGQSIARHLTDYWGRVAFSFVTLIMTMLGISLGFLTMPSRGAGTARGIGQALGIGFLFWAAHSIGIALGRSGALHPWLAGWIASMMLLALSVNLLLKVRY